MIGQTGRESSVCNDNAKIRIYVASIIALQLGAEDIGPGPLYLWDDCATKLVCTATMQFGTPLRIQIFSPNGNQGALPLLTAVLHLVIMEAAAPPVYHIAKLIGVCNPTGSADPPVSRADGVDDAVTTQWRCQNKRTRCNIIARDLRAPLCTHMITLTRC